MPKIKMIIDCDTGIDDALAISYILSNPNIELLGITTTFGNIPVDTSVRNTLALLNMLNRNDIKVYRGAEHGWNQEEYEREPFLDRVHGVNGIGDVEIEDSPNKAEDISAVDFILDCARKYPDELHLVFVGPLTNFANCIKQDEQALSKVKDITIMGGALTVTGNRNIYGEANVTDDPAAGKYVFDSSLHINVVPLDATMRTMFKASYIEDWTQINEAGKNLYEIAKFYYLGEFSNPETGGAMHDPLAAFASYDPTIITNWYECNVTIEETGRMIGTFDQLNLPEKRHKVALNVDAKRFTDTYVSMVSDLLKNIDE